MQGFIVEEILDTLLISRADFHQIFWQGASRTVAQREVGLKISTIAPNNLAETVQAAEQFQDIFQFLAAEAAIFSDGTQSHFLGGQLDENFIQSVVILNVFLTFLALDLVERRLRNIEVASFH